MSTGRNDPCPCGSGRRYKKCHLPLDDARPVVAGRRRHDPDDVLAHLLLDRFIEGFTVGAVKWELAPGARRPERTRFQVR
jgi:hypothetical protein